MEAKARRKPKPRRWLEDPTRGIRWAAAVCLLFQKPGRSNARGKNGRSQKEDYRTWRGARGSWINKDEADEA